MWISLLVPGFILFVSGGQNMHSLLLFRFYFCSPVMLQWLLQCLSPPKRTVHWCWTMCCHIEFLFLLFLSCSSLSHDWSANKPQWNHSLRRSTDKGWITCLAFEYFCFAPLRSPQTPAKQNILFKYVRNRSDKMPVRGIGDRVLLRMHLSYIFALTRLQNYLNLIWKAQNKQQTPLLSLFQVCMHSDLHNS